MSRRCRLPRDLKYAQQVNWDWIKAKQGDKSAIPPQIVDRAWRAG